VAERDRTASLREVLAKLDRTPGTIREAILWAEQELAAAKVDAPRLSAELLASLCLGLSRLGLIMREKDRLEGEQLAAFRGLVARRAGGEPVAYILGEKEFFGLAFRVTPNVLIPRPETELIVEQAQRLFAPDAAFSFADFGTGSGCLAVTLAHVFPRARGLAVDLSGQALEVARGNASSHSVDGRLEFLCADFTRLTLTPGSLDLIVANPPYVSESEYAALPAEVRVFEPREALESAEEGLWHLQALLPVAVSALRPGGTLLCELGCDQGPRGLALAQNNALGLVKAVILRDYAGLDRILFATKAA